MNKIVIAPISHNEYEDVQLNEKCLRHSINRSEGKDHNSGTYQLIKLTIFLCFALMTKYINKTMGMVDYVLVIRDNYKKRAILVTIQKIFFVKL